MIQTLHFSEALLPTGWARDVRVTLDDGHFAAIAAIITPPTAAALAGPEPEMPPSTIATRIATSGSMPGPRPTQAIANCTRRFSVSCPAASAGTQPAARVHPGAVAAAARHDLPMRPRRPRHLDEVLRPTDLVVAVCDNVHEELPPQAARLHWSIADPVRAGGARAFDHALEELVARIDQLAPTLNRPRGR